MNRFFDIPFIPSRELMPWESAKRGLSTTDGFFELSEKIRFRSDIAGGDLILEPPFVSNLASIPGSLGWFMASDDQRISGGAWFHDYLYSNQGIVSVYDANDNILKIATLHRYECDQILAFEAMPDLGANKLQCQTVYQTLRRFGDQWKGQSFSERFQG